ncbi:hypothetical protein BDV26DRAFT_285793 [Aspergillus bertholletiae]|uniref:Uncharacterized protein n=1 Tax=Aspergillus bertholletiae TaxID=1226010 RepID=A0A5N7ARZ5_9EURO|nr:hypothetical protein BDV26DRAFT_285793 [Aspergillus bertholletiae]
MVSDRVSSRSRTTVSYPFSAAQESGVRLELSLVSMSASPVSINSLTTKSCPFPAARDSGVRPASESLAFTSARPVSSNIRDTVSCPSSAAQASAVDPVTSFEFTLTFPVSRRTFTTASCPNCAANNSGVICIWSLESTSTRPVSSNSNMRTTSLCPFIAAIDNAVKPDSPPASGKAPSWMLIRAVPSTPYTAAQINAELSEFHALNRYKYGLATA